MFGIGLPELILIMGIALIVVGPDKLPEMAKSIARVVLDLKKTASSLKDSLQEELHDAQPRQLPTGDDEAAETAEEAPIIDAVSSPLPELPVGDQPESETKTGQTAEG